MTIIQAKDYFLARCDELNTLAERGDPWIFLCGSAMIDYLMQMATDKSGRLAYISFVEDYFQKVDSRYKGFQYQNGLKDLPTQMYVILRCGIVHKFSFVPDQQGINNGGRTRSILLGHEKNGLIHFQPYVTQNTDAVIFTAEQFSRDITKVVQLLFTEAENDLQLKSTISNYITKYPPILAIAE